MSVLHIHSTVTKMSTYEQLEQWKKQIHPGLHFGKHGIDDKDSAGEMNNSYK